LFSFSKASTADSARDYTLIFQHFSTLLFHDV
jgi:hypothetical protein